MLYNLTDIIPGFFFDPVDIHTDTTSCSSSFRFSEAWWLYDSFPFLYTVLWVFIEHCKVSWAARVGWYRADKAVLHSMVCFSTFTGGWSSLVAPSDQSSFWSSLSGPILLYTGQWSIKCTTYLIEHCQQTLSTTFNWGYVTFLICLYYRNTIIIYKSHISQTYESMQK